MSNHDTYECSFAVEMAVEGLQGIELPHARISVFRDEQEPSDVNKETTGGVHFAQMEVLKPFASQYQLRLTTSLWRSFPKPFSVVLHVKKSPSSRRNVWLTSVVQDSAIHTNSPTYCAAGHHPNKAGAAPTAVRPDKSLF